jgi:arylsulfatase A-like enzyme
VLDDGYKDEAVEKVGKHSPTGGLRGGKYSLFDGGAHVPFFVYWKDTVKPVVSDALVCQIDLMASLASMLGYRVPDGLDTQNQLDALLGRNLQGRKDLVLEADGRLAYRTADWALIMPYKGKERNLTGNELGNIGEYGLFDLKNDRTQQENLAKQRPEVVDELLEQFLPIVEGYYPPAVKK